ncbi:MAG TPA: peptide MFS transporter [Myxococcota bacterium]|nr:peptide MFS transporter [Myxococcota bacterium]
MSAPTSTAAAPVTGPPPEATPPEARKKQPIGLFLLFGTEMWERFSYYGMRAILVLYLIDTKMGGAGWPKTYASRLYGWYTGLVYLTPLAGGYLADKFIGTHRSLIIGGLIIACGHFSLAMHSMPTFYAGLVLIILGTGFFKPNVSTMVGQLYTQGDPRRDAGFTIFYMGINLGAFLGTFICGYLGESPQWGWHYGFGAAGVGMVCGLAMYVLGKRKYLGAIGEVPMARAGGAAAAANAAPLTREERDRVAAIFITAFFVIFFWLAFEQAGSSMNIFAAERTARTFFGYTIPASWFQNINPLAILVFGPAFATMWVRLGARGKEPSTPVKMATGLLLLGGGFVFMVIGGRISDGGKLAGPIWLSLAYLFHTWGELCLSPVGLSLVTKLAPVKFASLLMGTWFLANFCANLAGGYVAALVEKVERGEVFRLLGGEADFFLMFVVSSVLAATVLLLLTPQLKKLMHGRG